MDDRLRILIVDDDRGGGVTLADILNDKGYEAVVVSSGKSALKSMKEATYDIALVDIMMPGLNGVETFKEAKKQSGCAKFIMMTGAAAEEMIEEALMEGAYDVIFKPLKVDRLVSMIESCKASDT